MKNLTTIVLVGAILLLLNIMSRQYFMRFDLTKDKQYTLSKATKDILHNLEDPVTISAYFSKDLPPQISKTKNDFRDMLIEYANISKGMVDYEFIDPSASPELEQEAAKEGIQPVNINVREKDQLKSQKAYLGAVIRLGEQKEVVPLVQPGLAMEYTLSTLIKKLSVVDKPSVGLVQGHGEPGLQDLSQAYESLSILYHVENLDLSKEESIPTRFKAIAIVGTKDSIPSEQFVKLDEYLSRGGNIFIAMDAVKGDFQTAQGTALTTGLETWLKAKGLLVDPSFVVDNRCGNVQVAQRVGPMTIPTQIKFPYFPLVSEFSDHPITDGLERVALQFASPLNYVGKDSLSFTAILTSSEHSGTLQTPIRFDVQKQWTTADYPMSNIVMGGVLEGNIVGQTNSRIVLITDGEFPVSGQQRRQSADNVNLMVNSIDWLSDDTGLIALRTKGVTTRPIKELEDGERSMLKWGNFALPIILLLIYGFIRMQKQRSLRMKRMQENY